MAKVSDSAVVVIPSIMDGAHVPASSIESSPSSTIYGEFRRRLDNCDVKFTPGIIVEPSGRNVTYFELDDMVQRISSSLRGHLAKQRPVCVFLPPSCSRIATFLALNSLEIPFVPMDTVQAKQQRYYAIERSSAQAIITNREYELQLKEERSFNPERVAVVVIDEDCSVQSETRSSVDQETRSLAERDICAVLFTSGSTGLPKGIMLTNANLLNRLRWQWAELPFAGDGSDVCLAKTNPLFVDSYTEIFGAVLRLQHLVITFPKAGISNAIFEHKATRLILVPSLLRTILEEENAAERLSSLRLVVSSGEALPAELARLFFQKLSASPSQPRLANLYGSTEVTGDITAALFASEADVKARTVDEMVPIGRPLHNTTIFVCQENSIEPVPMGEVGRICVSGANVCFSIVGNANFGDKFLDKPHSLATIGTGDRLFFMGDLGRILPGGDLVFCGRSDSIAKILGNRVSTLQVEEALKEVLRLALSEGEAHQRNQILKCRVLAVDNLKSATQRLAAFYELPPDPQPITLRPDYVRKALSTRLARYAVPELLFPLAAGTFPLQPQSGKYDQRALKLIAEEAYNRSNVDVGTALANFSVKDGELAAQATEAVRLVTAYALSIDATEVIMDATFFNQGGNSISVVAAVAALRRIGYKKAAAELFLKADSSLNDVATVLSNTSLVSASSSEEYPSWMEFRNLADLTESEQTYVKERMAYTFAIEEPLTVLLGVAASLLNPINSNWPLFIKSGPVSFIAVDKRQVDGSNIAKAIVGGSVNTDFMDEPADDCFKDVEPIGAILEAAERPIRDELLQKYGGNIPRGTILTGQMVYVDHIFPKNDGAFVFLSIERELIRRAREAGYKLIVTENSSPATQIMERDLMGFNDRFAVHARTFEMPDGTRPFAGAAEDYHVRGMTLDLEKN